MLGRSVFAAGHGYGMGVAVVMEPDKADLLRCRGGRLIPRERGYDQQVCPDLSGAQHAGAAANGEWHRSGRVERHPEVPRARVRMSEPAGAINPSLIPGGYTFTKILRWYIQ